MTFKKMHFSCPTLSSCYWHTSTVSQVTYGVIWCYKKSGGSNIFGGVYTKRVTNPVTLESVSMIYNLRDFTRSMNGINNELEGVGWELFITLVVLRE